MVLQFNGQREAPLYKRFPLEGTRRKIDLLSQVGAESYTFISARQVVDRRMNVPDDARVVWQEQFFFTGDACTGNTEGDSVYTLDEKALFTLTPAAAGSLIDGGLPRSAEEFAELCKHGCYLTAQQTVDLFGKGWTYSGGIWKPDSPVVAKATDFILREMSETNRIQYLNGVRDDSTGNDTVMRFYPTISNGKSAIMKFVAVDSTISGSASNFFADCLDHSGFLVGVAPKAPVARDERSGLERFLHDA